MDDPIVKEVREARDRLARKFNYDLHALFADMRKREEALGRRLVHQPPREKSTSSTGRL